MVARLTMIWAQIRDSLWFIPALLTCSTSVAALLLVEFERRYDLEAASGTRWLVSTSVDGAREVLSTIAGSLITVTGVIFSITIVALQLASSQFTPRILRNFLADRVNQLVLGVFIATFTYTLLVLRVVRSLQEGDQFVPHLAVNLAIVMALVSVGFLIYYIHHAARIIQADVILDAITTDALRQVKKLFPQEIGDPASQPPADESLSTSQAQIVAAINQGYLYAVDGHSLFELGEQHHLLIRMLQPVGTFILEGQELAEVWAEGALPDDIRQKICAAFLLGKERTPEQDIEFFVIEIADMAVKALSPGINDPTTAAHCIDRLAQILLAMGKRRPPAPTRTESGEVHFIALPSTFESAVGVAFGQILHYCRDDPAIIAKLRSSLQTLEQLLPTEQRGPVQAFRARLQACSDKGKC